MLCPACGYSTSQSRAFRARAELDKLLICISLFLVPGAGIGVGGQGRAEPQQPPLWGSSLLPFPRGLPSFLARDKFSPCFSLAQFERLHCFPPSWPSLPSHLGPEGAPTLLTLSTAHICLQVPQKKTDRTNFPFWIQQKNSLQRNLCSSL